MYPTRTPTIPKVKTQKPAINPQRGGVLGSVGPPLGPKPVAMFASGMMTHAKERSISNPPNCLLSDWKRKSISLVDMLNVVSWVYLGLWDRVEDDVVVCEHD